MSGPLRLPILGYKLLEALLWEVENVRSRSKADIADRLTHVRFTHESRRSLARSRCRFVPTAETGILLQIRGGLKSYLRLVIGISVSSVEDVPQRPTERFRWR